MIWDEIAESNRPDPLEQFRELLSALPVWGPDDRGLYILDNVDIEGLLDDYDQMVQEVRVRVAELADAQR